MKMYINLNEYNIGRFAVVSPELKIADVEFNTEKIKEAIEQGLEKDCYFYLFPELCLTGYSCGDLFFQSNMETAVYRALSDLVSFSLLKSVNIIVGAPIRSSGKMFNTAVFISCGEIIGIVPKTFIPNNDEYYEERWFSGDFDRTEDSLDILGCIVPFGADLIFQAKDFPLLQLGIEICEDLWSVVPSSSDLALEGCNVLLNLSASSEYLGKAEYRKSLVAAQSARCHAAYLYSSAGPGESSTDFIMAGHCLIAENGKIICESERFKFETQMIIADIDLEKLNSERLKNSSFAIGKSSQEFRVVDFEYGFISSTQLYRSIPKMPFVPAGKENSKHICEEILNIQVTALAKRLRHINAKQVVLGISGGLDSTLALIVCVKTFEKLGLDRKGIIAVSMPCFGTSERTRLNAKKLAELFDVSFSEIDISKSVSSHFEDIGHSELDYGIVYENAQARMRTLVLMDIANKQNAIVIGTGDLSEIALGWSTYNGDHISMYSVNSGIPKTLVIYMIEVAAESMFDKNTAEILKDIVDTPISPELLPANASGLIAQKTENIIGPYLLHDFFLYYFVRFGYSPSKILLMAKVAFADEYKFDEIKNVLKVFLKRFFTNQYKRSCTPDGVKVGTVALSPRGDWRMPSDAMMDIWLSEIDICEE